MFINTFIQKSNTIIDNSEINSGLNPVTELYYGADKSVFIFKFNFENIKNKINDGLFSEVNNLKHTLRLTNCGGFSELRKNEFSFNELTASPKKRATSFDLILFRLPIQEWDSGKGFWYGKNANYETSGSNFFNAKTETPWLMNDGEEDFYDLIKDEYIINTIHFDRGDEDISVDVTEYVNNVLNGEMDSGLGLCFSKDFLKTNETNLNFVSFFTNNSKTYFQPTIQTDDLCYINDDRNNLIFGKPSKIYFYSLVNGITQDLDEIPICEINNVKIDVKKERKGIYSIFIDEYDKYQIDADIMNSDCWSNIVINGYKLPTPIEQSFTIKNNYEDLLNDKIDYNDFELFVGGINQNETLKYGEIKQICLTPKVMYDNIIDSNITNINFNISIKEGDRVLNIVENGILDKINGKFYFTLDANSFVPNTYYIDFYVNKGVNIKKVFKDKISFKVAK